MSDEHRIHQGAMLFYATFTALYGLNHGIERTFMINSEVLQELKVLPCLTEKMLLGLIYVRGNWWVVAQGCNLPLDTALHLSRDGFWYRIEAHKPVDDNLQWNSPDIARFEPIEEAK